MYYEKHMLSDRPIPIIINKSFARQHAEKELRFLGNWHESVEFIYIINGNAEVYYERDKIDVEEGDMVIVNSNCNHFINTTATAEFYYMIIDKSFFEQNGLSVAMQFQSKLKCKSYEEFFNTVHSLYIAKEPLYEAKIRMEVLRMLIEVSEKYCLGYMPENFIPEYIREAVRYIKENYQDKLTVEDILKKVGFSRAHFSREFKKYVGVSVIEYVNYVKCNHARMLMSKGSSVSEAAEMCGFNNLSYFSRMYRKIIGNLPSEDLNKK